MIYGLVKNIDRSIVGSGTKFSTCMSNTKIEILDLLSVYFFWYNSDTGMPPTLEFQEVEEFHIYAKKRSETTTCSSL